MKSQVPSFTHSKDMLGDPKFKNGSREPNHASFEGWFVIRRLGSTMVNLPIKFVVTVFSGYKQMKGNTKCRKLGELQ